MYVQARQLDVPSLLASALMSSSFWVGPRCSWVQVLPFWVSQSLKHPSHPDHGLVLNPELGDIAMLLIRDSPPPRQICPHLAISSVRRE